MKAIILFMLVVILAEKASGDALLPERSYRILMLLPVSSRSHMNIFVALAEALAHRGHKIIMLTNQPSQSTHPNILEVHHGLTHMALAKRNMFHERKNSSTGFAVFPKILPAMARDLYKVPSVQDLYEKRKENDLLVVDHMFNEIVYPFLHELPFITVAVPGIDTRHSAVLGNVLNPSYVPNLWTSYPFPMSLWQRLKNTALHIWISFYWRHWGVVPRIQKEISVHFPDLPPLLDIERNQSLTLMNTHFSITTPVPLLPSQVEVGAIQCRLAKPLPQDIESWIAGAGPAGVIYFSLGSLTRGDSMLPEYLQVFLEAFRRLPQRILWKYEEQLEGASDNVRISSWLPQQDILAHHNVKVFISHGGLLSLQESIFHATPLLVLPIFGDQPRNGMFVEDSGIGRTLVWEKLTADSIVDTLTDIINNTKYKEDVDRMSASLRDQPMTPQERAVFWTEYVIRHRGAPQLRCPAAQLSWVEFLMLDMMGLLLLTLLVLLLLIRRLLRGISAILPIGSCKKKRD
ncbi:UDP-glycosyltransferase UGT5-like isoform X2 [Portunus trituberculatus]|uniref:UDP-glycosyltransferase UGT5-like isoform X2 n=1 Tax=Portunus trituberculatus TaxID=210409 RepID=UPI001E1D05C3|nr:UDP-glycosyltransferase UGT5-like isoform X2 [Portunus trituberculatus]